MFGDFKIKTGVDLFFFVLAMIMLVGVAVWGMKKLCVFDVLQGFYKILKNEITRLGDQSPTHRANVLLAVLMGIVLVAYKSLDFPSFVCKLFQVETDSTPNLGYVLAYGLIGVIALSCVIIFHHDYRYAPQRKKLEDILKK
ncbi:hypothetical protein [Victivallis vadensis]|uniref:hypothetical protein n=1 Tax=Victivallis vadensis TaxID=172901 RepID=UPI0023F9F998|nr:hypothetical protein [Victivallis vadensis]